MLPRTIAFIIISVVIALLLIITMPVFSQIYVPPYLSPEEIRPATPEHVGEPIDLNVEDVSHFNYNSTALTLEWNPNYSLDAAGCYNDFDPPRERFDPDPLEEQREQERLIKTYTDLKGNTVKIYCQYNEWLGEDERLRQYTAFYNDKILVGMCPYDYAVNRHEIRTNSEGEISSVNWFSVRTNGTDYVVFNILLG
jgi:hypothetical protein